MDIIVHTYRSPVGELLLGSIGDALCLCDWTHRKQRAAVDARLQRGAEASYVEGRSAVIDQAVEQLDAYFRGERTRFDIPLRFIGSDFQVRVWEALCGVPYGSTVSYAALTERVAEPTAIRAVAAANGANALSILVPCHRVVGSDGSLVGYAGGLPAKRRLLALEGAAVPLMEGLFAPVEG